MYHGQKKHIAFFCHSICDDYASGGLILEKIGTHSNVSSIMTKLLSQAKFSALPQLDSPFSLKSYFFCVSSGGDLLFLHSTLLCCIFLLLWEVFS